MRFMADFKLPLSLLSGRTIAGMILATKGGGATAAPGLIALKIDKDLVRKLSKKIDKTIVISGTNGKTTTARLLAASAVTIYPKSQIIHNRQGSNLLRGVATSLVRYFVPFSTKRARLGLWEADEASFGEIIKQTRPKIIVLTNLFRDQLDRYGEVDLIFKKIKEAINSLGYNPDLVLNSDDPNIASLGRDYKGGVYYFGLNDEGYSDHAGAGVLDAIFCPTCGNVLTFNKIYFSHIGDYFCSKCLFRRPEPFVSITDVKSKSFNSDGKTFVVRAKLNGLYNLYNYAATLAVFGALGGHVDKAFLKSLENVEAVFGRQEKMQIGDLLFEIILVKNPVGFNEVLKSLPKRRFELVLLLNDNLADGRDVSWIWDVDFERNFAYAQKIYCGGKRSFDLANRLKYAEIDKSKIFVQEDIDKLLTQTIRMNKSKKNTLYVLPTYTALLELKNFFFEKGFKKEPWHE